MALTCLVVFWPWLFTGRTFYWGDFGLYFRPMSQLLREQWLQGRLPLWNPHLFGGAPYIGNPQTWPLYPTSLLLPFFSAPVFLMVCCVLHLFGAGLSAFVLLHRGHLKLALWPSLLGAVTFILGGFVISKTQFPNMLQALCFLPLLLLLSERLVEKPNARTAMAFGCALGLQILAAHAQIALYSVYLVLIFALWRWRVVNNTLRHFVRCFGWVMLSFALALAISCVQWLPVVEFTRLAGRAEFPLAEANRFHFLPHELTNFFWPHRFGSPFYGNWSAPGNFWEKACYVGIVPLLFALGGLTTLRNDAEERHAARFWTTIAFASVLLSLGARGGLYLIAFHSVPGVSVFHDPARLLLGAAIAIPILAAIGLQQLLSARLFSTQPRRAGLLGAFAVVIAIIDLARFDHVIYPLEPVRELENAAASSTLIRALHDDSDIAQRRARVIFLDPQGYLGALHSYTDFMQRDARLLQMLTETLPPNLPMTLSLLQAGGYDPVALTESKGVIRSLVKQLPLETKSRGADFANQLAGRSIKYIATIGPRPLDATSGLQLFWTSAWQKDGRRSRVYRNNSFKTRLPENIKWREPSPNQIEALVAPSTSAQDLIIRDTMYPAWRAYLGEREIKVEATPEGFRGISLASHAQPQKLAMVYNPSSFRLGLFVSMLALCFVAAFRCAMRRMNY